MKKENTNPNNGQALKSAIKKDATPATPAPPADLGMGLFSPLKTAKPVVFKETSLETEKKLFDRR